jgi:hypothetical protein
VLHALTLETTDEIPPPQLKVIGPGKVNTFTTVAATEGSVVFSNYTIPTDSAGGDYKIEVTYPYDEGYGC